MAIAIEPRRAFGSATTSDETVASQSSLWHAYIAVLAAACVMVGVYWDISWHMSIGRDTFWTPAHLLIQAGGLIAGLSSGYVALKTTFGGSEAERNSGVSFWGFRAPLGAWICVWGCGAMLASAPFDNWWHNAYGLDVKIVSPPHVILALGIYAIVVGALLLTLAEQNRAVGDARRRLALALAATGGLFIMNFALFLTEFSERRFMHSTLFYGVIAATFPFGLTSMARAIKLRWPATAAATAYTLAMILLMWIVEAFPATPKLGPIYQHITHMVALSFPLLIIAPAIAIDVVLRRAGDRFGVAVLAPIVAVVFLVAFVAVQWPFATFLVYSPLAQGPIFNADNFVYWMHPAYEALTKRFDPTPANASPLVMRLAVVFGVATLSSVLGLRWGRWMTKVRR
ncbi:MAG TPA: hypothetical protein VK636_11875 [Gemmatimonadaceae bacterium]|nr:hypothetical protein [Gemmatimonadaceae bacterium]